MKVALTAIDEATLPAHVTPSLRPRKVPLALGPPHQSINEPRCCSPDYWRPSGRWNEHLLHHSDQRNMSINHNRSSNAASPPR